MGTTNSRRTGSGVAKRRDLHVEAQPAVVDANQSRGLVGSHVVDAGQGAAGQDLGVLEDEPLLPRQSCRCQKHQVVVGVQCGLPHLLLGAVGPPVRRARDNAVGGPVDFVNVLPLDRAGMRPLERRGHQHWLGLPGTEMGGWTDLTAYVCSTTLYLVQKDLGGHGRGPGVDSRGPFRLSVNFGQLYVTCAVFIPLVEKERLRKKRGWSCPQLPSSGWGSLTHSARTVAGLQTRNRIRARRCPEPICQGR